jgi:hypothetical protein
MLSTILSWLGGPIAKALAEAYKARLVADTDEKRLVADGVIAGLEHQAAANREAAGVVKEGMKHWAFWIPWSIAAVPTAAWFGWGMTDSLMNGSLPDVAALPPQLKGYADVVFANIFYSGAGMAGFQAIASAIRGRK